jgi:predicted dehydrogenase
MERAKVKVAIIGTGGIAGSHMRAWEAWSDAVEPVAAVDIDGERAARFASQHGIPHTYTDAVAMLETEHPDLVHICTPPAFHFPIIEQCLRAGAWVLCEKPLCSSLEQLDRIAALEQETGAACASVFQWRFGSAALRVRQLARSGQFGSSRVVLCDTTWYRDDAYYAVPWRGTWASELGGVSMGHAIHIIDLMVWLMGEWSEITAVTDTLARQIEVEDVAMAIVRFENRALCSIVNSVLSPRQETRLRLDYERATVEVTGLYGYTNANWSITPLEGHDAVLASWPPEEDEPSSHAAQFGHLLAALQNGTPPAANVADVRATFELLTALYKSSRTGQMVKRGSITSGDPYYAHIAGYEDN